MNPITPLYLSWLDMVRTGEWRLVECAYVGQHGRFREVSRARAKYEVRLWKRDARFAYYSVGWDRANGSKNLPRRDLVGIDITGKSVHLCTCMNPCCAMNISGLIVPEPCNHVIRVLLEPECAQYALAFL